MPVFKLVFADGHFVAIRRRTAFFHVTLRFFLSLLGLGLLCWQVHFLGHELWDEETTIIHHFDEPRSLAYPALPSGLALSVQALRK